MSNLFGGFAVLLLIASPWVDPSAAWIVYTMGATCVALALILRLFND